MSIINFKLDNFITLLSNHISDTRQVRNLCQRFVSNKRVYVSFDNHFNGLAAINMINYRIKINPRLLITKVLEAYPISLEEDEQISDVIYWDTVVRYRKYCRDYRDFCLLHEIGHYLYTDSYKNLKAYAEELCPEIPGFLISYVNNVVEDSVIQKRFCIDFNTDSIIDIFKFGIYITQGTIPVQSFTEIVNKVEESGMQNFELNIRQKLFYFIMKVYNEYDDNVQEMWKHPEYFAWSQETLDAFDTAVKITDTQLRCRYTTGTFAPLIYKDLLQLVNKAGSKTSSVGDLLDQPKLYQSNDNSDDEEDEQDDTDDSNDSEELNDSNDSNDSDDSDDSSEDDSSNTEDTVSYEDEESDEDFDSEDSDEDYDDSQDSEESEDEDESNDDSDLDEENSEDDEDSDEPDEPDDDEEESEEESDSTEDDSTEEDSDYNEESDEGNKDSGDGCSSPDKDKDDDALSKEDFDDLLEKAVNDISQNFNSESTFEENPPLDADTLNAINSNVINVSSNYFTGGQSHPSDLVISIYNEATSVLQRLYTQSDVVVRGLEQGELDDELVVDYFVNKSLNIYKEEYPAPEGKDILAYFLLDVSGSMWEKLPYAKQAFEALIYAFNAVHIKTCLLTFSDDTKLVKPFDMDIPFSNPSELTSALSYIYGEGGTDIMDALNYIINDYYFKDPKYHKIVIIGTDGDVDDLDKSIAQAIADEALVFVLGFDFNAYQWEGIPGIIIKSYSLEDIVQQLPADIYEEVANKFFM